MAIKVGAVRRLLLASPEYLDRHGAPRSAEDLKNHAIIAFTGLMPGTDIRVFKDGKPVLVSVRPRLTVNDAGAALAAAMDGNGVAPALSYMVKRQVADGRLVVALKSLSPPPVPVHLVYPAGRLLSAKVRAFVDFARPRLKRVLADASN